MLLPHATWRTSEGHFVRALQACVHYFSAYPRSFIFFTTHHAFSPFLNALESTTNDKVPWPNCIHSIYHTLVISLFIDEEISGMLKYDFSFDRIFKNTDKISALVRET
jgi:hypothetical protein